MQTINSSIRSYSYGAFGIMAIFMSIFSFSTTVLADEGDWSASDWSFSGFSDSTDVWNEVSYGGYNGIGESGSSYTSMFDSTNWLVADYTNYTSIGDAGYGCCDVATYATADTSVWTPVDYGNYTGIGDAGAGCCDVTTYATADTAVWTPVDYGNYTGIGDAGAGCCDITAYANVDPSVWTPVDYGNYTGIGDAGAGCCDVTTYASNNIDTWTDTNYTNYTGIGDAGAGCCDVTAYQPTTYTPSTVAYTGDYDYVPYQPTTYTYTPVTYTPTTYTYTPTTYTYTSPTYTPTTYTYTSPTYTYTPTTYTPTTYTYNPTTYTYTPVVYDTIDMPSCDSFTASDYFVNDNDTITLTWRTSDATGVYINKGVGTVAQDGTKRVTITDDITYELIASNGQTSVNCSVTIEIDDNDDDTDTRAPHCEFNASDRNIEEGDEVKLSWDNLRTDDIVIRDNRGDTIVNTRSSSRYDADRDSIDIKPTRTTTYTLTAKNGSREDECQVTVSVDEDDDTTRTEIPRCELTASDRNIEEGDEVKLSWDNVRTDDIVLRDNHGDTLVNTKNGGSYDADKDSITVEPDETTTYTLTAKNGSREDKCTVKVTVDEDKKTTKSSEAPRCVFSVSDTTVSRGEKVTLSWKNQRTDRLIIKDNHGREIIDSKDDKKIDEDQDAIIVQPTQSTTYTLTVKNGSKDRDCTVKVAVGGNVSVTSIRSQDGIPLNQVPYTGFDASDMLVMIFYSGVGIWVSIMGYGLWMKRKETLAYSDNMIE